MSGSAFSPLVSGPETPFVVDAVDGLLRGDRVAARVALLEGAEVAGWSAIAHRLDVVGRALAVDAGLWDPSDPAGDGSAQRGDIVVLPGLDTSSVFADDVDAPEFAAAEVIHLWTTGDGSALPLDRIWPSLTVVAWLVERAGYPPEVVA